MKNQRGFVVVAGLLAFPIMLLIATVCMKFDKAPEEKPAVATENQPKIAP